MSAARRPLPVRTREDISACAAVGLDYWAKHPAAGMLWAVDGRDYHAVQIRRSVRIARHVCCTEEGGVNAEAEYVIRETDELLSISEIPA